MRQVSVAILAGGLGSRLRPAVSDRPKALAPIGGRPFLAFLLERLGATGVQHAVLCTGYLGESIRTCFGEHYAHLRLSYSQEPSLAGTAGALRLAIPLLTSETVLVLNADSYCHADLSAYLGWHRERGAEASMLLARVPDSGRYGRVEIDALGRVLHFAEKVEGGSPAWVNAGVYLFGRGFLEELASGDASSLEREVLPAWVGRGLYAYRSPCRFIDIGTPEDYAAAQRFFPSPASSAAGAVA